MADEKFLMPRCLEPNFSYAHTYTMAVKTLLGKFQYLRPKYCFPALSLRNCFTDGYVADLSPQALNNKCINTVTLLGNAGVDPKEYEINDKKVVFFTLATQKSFVLKTDSTVTRKYVTWHQIIVRKSDVQEYVMKEIVKGSRVFVTGFINYKNFVDTDLQYISGLHIVAGEVIGLRKPRNAYTENTPYLSKEDNGISPD